MKESEKLLEKKLKERIGSLGGLCIKLETNFMVGLPDRLCLLPDKRIFFAEVKTTGERPKKIQLWMHNKLRKLGFEVLVIDRSEQIEQIC